MDDSEKARLRYSPGTGPWSKEGPLDDVDLAAFESAAESGAFYSDLRGLLSGCVTRLVREVRRLHNTCPDCNVPPGSVHTPGCDVERCSVCGRQALTHVCEGHDPMASKWDGEWPGVPECRKRGWYTVDLVRAENNNTPHPIGGCWWPCTPDYPNATEDLNRLAHWRRLGKDPYEGCTVPLLTPYRGENA